MADEQLKSTQPEQPEAISAEPTESADESLVPEVESREIGSSALVPAAPVGRFQGTITRFLERVMPTPRFEMPPEFGERLDALEVQIAGLEELVGKRLEEGEGRTLHLVEKRLEALNDDVRSLARRAAEREVAKETQSLRIQILAIGGLAVGLAAAALVFALNIL